jgi:hypothetical protein
MKRRTKRQTRELKTQEPQGKQPPACAVRVQFLIISVDPLSAQGRAWTRLWARLLQAPRASRGAEEVSEPMADASADGNR